MVNLQKVITKHKKRWYMKIVDKEEAEGTDIEASLHVYDEWDGRFLACASLKRVSDLTLTLAVRFSNLVYTLPAILLCPPRTKTAPSV